MTNPVTGKRERTRTYFRTETEALRAQRLPTVWNPDAATPASDWLLAWSEQRRESLERNGQLSTASATCRNARLVAARFGRLKLGEVNKQFLDQMWLDLLTTPQKADGEPYARKYVTDCRSTLNQAFNDAEGKGIVTNNPSRMSSLPTVRVSNRVKQNPMLTADELRRYIKFLWSLLDDDDAIDWVLFALIVAYTGCRRGEALGLRFCDFVEATPSTAPTLQFSQQVNTTDADVYVGTLKTDRSYRKIAIPPKLAAAIARERNRRPDSGQTPALINPRKPLPNPDAFSSWVRRSFARAGVPTLSVHALRHTVASLLIVNQKMSPLEVAALLGHANPSFTAAQYAHLSTDDVAAVGTSLGKLIDGDYPGSSTNEGETP